MQKVEKWLTEDNLMLITAWARDGYTKSQIAEMMGINRKTLLDWSKAHKEIEEALSHQKELVDYKVENALLKRCLGFSTTKRKVVIDMEKRTTKTEEEYSEIAPDPTSIAIWLNNRKPERWKRNRDNFITVEDEDNELNINIVRPSKNNNSEQENSTGLENSNKNNKSTINKKEEDPWEGIEDEEEW